MSEFSPSGQLSLPVKLDDSATLDNFFVPDGSANQSLLAALRSQPTQGCYLWGNEGAGVTHLLQGLCHQAQAHSLVAMYLPLQELQAESPDRVLQGLENTDLLCIDDLHVVLSDSGWAEHLFHLFNRIQIANRRLVFGANSPPAQIETPLADLRSRLSSLLVYRVEKLSDEEVVLALIDRAYRRGMDMPKAVAEYLVTRFSRKLGDQFHSLDILDAATLAEKRKLTVPFVKSVLER